MTEYIKNPLSGKLRGVTYEDGKIIDVHIRDTDDVVKVFVPVRHGRWEKAQDMRRMDGNIYDYRCSLCDSLAEKGGYNNYDKLTNYCPNCGAKMDGGADNDM